MWRCCDLGLDEPDESGVLVKLRSCCKLASGDDGKAATAAARMLVNGVADELRGGVVGVSNRLLEVDADVGRGGAEETSSSS